MDGFLRRQEGQSTGTAGAKISSFGSPICISCSVSSNERDFAFDYNTASRTRIQKGD